MLLITIILSGFGVAATRTLECSTYENSMLLPPANSAAMGATGNGSTPCCRAQAPARRPPSSISRALLRPRAAPPTPSPRARASSAAPVAAACPTPAPPSASPRHPCLLASRVTGAIPHTTCQIPPSPCAPAPPFSSLSSFPHAMSLSFNGVAGHRRHRSKPPHHPPDLSMPRPDPSVFMFFHFKRTAC